MKFLRLSIICMGIVLPLSQAGPCGQNRRDLGRGLLPHGCPAPTADNIPTPSPSPEDNNKIDKRSSDGEKPSASEDDNKDSDGDSGNNQPSTGGNDVPNGAGNGKCEFPWKEANGDNVILITPDKKNAGWAMSPDQSCEKNGWCPYACAPGYYSAQWDPNAKDPSGPGSMNGGLFCDGSGKLSKPFPEKPFCEKGMWNGFIKNTLGESVSACQTIYPGNEAMLIPTVAKPGESVAMNIVPNSYWLGTSSQFYVNLAGSDGSKCIWGDDKQPIGNWGPYIFGGGQSKDGNTYISVQFNPLYKEKGFDLSKVYSVEIKCTSGKCNFPEPGECKCKAGGQCSVENGCTVTLPPGATADWVLS
ncbi:hypothetical protein H4219_002210 [Mycoemilia scoparia]|uniref:Uncharacterized protein n=1 Tax=Mycoemilia scoparia TaxID=417184 RepID=A0A9W8DV24_9FUNG|nr:hypothetical protein H4219_002210 [Mycoemilia scoparia]